MGAIGPAVVRRIHPCPELEPDDGSGRRVVTGTFRHSAANLLDLHVEGEADPLGVTDNHPFWSEDRQAFVPAGDLRLGERLLRADGAAVQVARLTPRRGPPVEVFNLEVDVEHVYYVGDTGALVHNHYVYEGWRTLEDGTKIRYLGITKDIERRSKEHARLGREILAIQHLDDLSYNDARAVEQVLIEHFGLENLDNVINSIATSNAKYDDAIVRGTKLLEDLKLFGF